MFTRERYGRYWAVYEDGSLLCVTVYKKGASAVIERLAPGKETSARAQVPQLEPCGSTPRTLKMEEGIEEKPKEISEA